MKNILDSLLYLFYPEVCLGCGNSLVSGEKVICTHCEVNLPRTRFHSDPANEVARIFWGRVKVEAATSFLYFRKGGAVQHLMHQFKYKGEREIGTCLGKMFASELESEGFYSSADFIIPVPLHPDKEKKRGFNQSRVFASGLSEILSIPLETEALVRRKFSETQTKKARYKRWENVKEIFELKHKDKINGKSVILVDDVVTTGATLEACASLLIEKGNAKAGIATLAIASQ